MVIFKCTFSSFRVKMLEDQGWPTLETSVVFSPLLDFVHKLSENRASEVVWQTVGCVVFDEGFNDSLQNKIKNKRLKPGRLKACIKKKTICQIFMELC